MFEFEVTRNGKTASVLIRANNQDTYSTALFTGDINFAEWLRWELSKKFGAFGHSIDLQATTAVDIDAALQQISGIEVKQVGEKTVSDYGSLPSGQAT